MLMNFSAIIAGFFLLVWAADRFVIGSAAIARNLGVSPIIIGLTIVGLGTSAPEMFVSAIAAWDGAPGMGIGNALGSNITNIGLILGVTALIVPMAIRSETLKREFPILFVIMLLGIMLMIDGHLGRFDGVILLVGMCIITYWLVGLGMRTRKTDPMESEYAAEIPKKMPMWIAIMWFLVGLIALLVSSRILVWGAVNVAQAFGISDLIIGLTIIAIGTSLPELAASVMSALKKEPDIAIGNVLGSNMYNLLVVLALPGLIEPSSLPDQVMTRDYPVMIGLTAALFAMGYGFRGRSGLNRMEGSLLLTAFIIYQGVIFWSARG